MRNALERIAPVIGWCGVVLMSLAILSMFVIAGLSFRDTRGDEGAAAMGIAIAFAMVVPLVVMVAGLACWTGSLLCRSAMRKSGTNQYESLVRRCRRIPLVALWSWVACLALICLASR